MKQTVTESQFRDAFRSIAPDDFSYAALGELYTWLEQYGDDTGEEMELDVISLCCDFGEYTLEELENDYGYMFGEGDEKPDDLDEWAKILSDHTMVIPVGDESLIVQDF